MSESQERMMAVVSPDKLDAFLDVCAKWDVTATVIGTVTDVTAEEAERGGRLRMRWHGETIVDLPPRTAADEGPIYRRPIERPYDQDVINKPHGQTLPRPRNAAGLRATLLRLVGSANLADPGWITDQYDRFVMGNTVLAQPENSGMIRVDESTGRGIALSVDGNARYARLDPYAGAQLALAEAYRNVATTGARPLAVTNCLNFGSPEDPGVMWQFSEAVRGLADGCQALGVPVTGGNVSFYNQTETTPILPTPVIGVLGVIADVRRRVRRAFRTDGAAVFLLGETRDEFGGSEWARVEHDFLGGLPPSVDLAAEQLLADVLVTAAAEGLLDSAHDLAEGGLAQALVESCLAADAGVRVQLPVDDDPFVALFSESSARAVVSVTRSNRDRFVQLCAERNQPHVEIGTVDLLAGTLEVVDQFTAPLRELRTAATSALPQRFDA